jgi:hypothetical protein
MFLISVGAVVVAGDDLPGNAAADIPDASAEEKGGAVVMH